MSKNHFQPYQPLLLRLLHGMTAISSILAIITAFWTYNTYDGRWGKLSLPDFKAIEGIHGTFGLWSLLIFPLFVIYAFQRGKNRLIQADFLSKISNFKQKVWWYNLHRLINTLTILSLTFAVFSGKMMDEKWLPQGELNHNWYYGHLISWLIMVICLFFHILMSIKVGGFPLILSMLNRKYKAKDSPILWQKNMIIFKENWQLILREEWLKLPLVFKVLEIFILSSLILAWLISIFK